MGRYGKARKGRKRAIAPIDCCKGLPGPEGGQLGRGPATTGGERLRGGFSGRTDCDGHGENHGRQRFSVLRHAFFFGAWWMIDRRRGLRGCQSINQ
jgi:hypothetical protein